MKERDKIFHTSKKIYDFEFNKDVVNVFDDMAKRSIPFYDEIQRMVVEIATTFVQSNTKIYDLGCSTGTTLFNIANNIKESGVTFVGVDNSESMIQKAKERLRDFDNIELLLADFKDINIDNASIVNMTFTLQFVRPLYRDILIKKVYDGLNDGGVLIVFEKVLSDNSLLNRTYIDYYYDYKRRMHYSDIEISKKREALENVLIPYRVSENIEIFKRNGFEVVDTFFRWYNWAGFICIKHTIEH